LVPTTKNHRVGGIDALLAWNPDYAQNPLNERYAFSPVMMVLSRWGRLLDADEAANHEFIWVS
jgi:hypothetical protein